MPRKKATEPETSEDMDDDEELSEDEIMEDEEVTEPLSNKEEVTDDKPTQNTEQLWKKHVEARIQNIESRLFRLGV